MLVNFGSIFLRRSFLSGGVCIIVVLVILNGFCYLLLL